MHVRTLAASLHVHRTHARTRGRRSRPLRPQHRAHLFAIIARRRRRRRTPSYALAQLAQRVCTARRRAFASARSHIHSQNTHTHTRAYGIAAPAHSPFKKRFSLVLAIVENERVAPIRPTPHRHRSEPATHRNSRSRVVPRELAQRAQIAFSVGPVCLCRCLDAASANDHPFSLSAPSPFSSSSRQCERTFLARAADKQRKRIVHTLRRCRR